MSEKEVTTIVNKRYGHEIGNIWHKKFLGFYCLKLKNLTLDFRHAKCEDGPSQAPVLAEVHPEVYPKGSRIIYGKGSSNRAAEGLDEFHRIASLSDEERSKVHSIEIAFQWQDIPRDEFEQYKNTVRSEKVAGRGFWSLSQDERTHRVHDKYREEIIKIWIAEFAALDAFK
ncbi:MAG: hypothetical protein M1835_001355 [Candelina submexicana]|nr:MAG: hypothetical protein M1835_001355 [Candelina submexicana]